jgi:ribosomal protein S1/cold shock CspA family protein
MPTGYISHINKTGHYGFIDSPELDIAHIFFHRINCKKSYENIYKGDKISFEYNPVVDEKNGVDEISFLQNASLDNLKSDFKNGYSLKGFLKKVDDKFYVKDRETYIYIRLIIANYEINIEEVYECNLNKLIDYKIVTFTSKNKIRAININRQFLPECKLLVEGNITEGQIVSTIKGGYQIRIYDNILGFLPKSLADKGRTVIEDGEIVNVTCIQADDNLANVIFDLTENLENEINLKIEQEKFVESLNPGNKFSGKIKKTQGFGAFISFGLSEGLLHINHIIDEPITLSKSSRKEFFKMFEKVFHKGKDIDVIIEENINNRISLNWDKTSERNKNLYRDIYDIFRVFENNR